MDYQDQYPSNTKWQWHEDLIEKYAQDKVKDAKKARVRAPAHVGGENEDEEEHITVIYRNAEVKDLKTPEGKTSFHVPRGRAGGPRLTGEELKKK